MVWTYVVWGLGAWLFFVVIGLIIWNLDNDLSWIWAGVMVGLVAFSLFQIATISYTLEKQRWDKAASTIENRYHINVTNIHGHKDGLIIFTRHGHTCSANLYGDWQNATMNMQTINCENVHDVDSHIARAK